MLVEWTIRVCRVETVPAVEVKAAVAPYRLSTEVYGDQVAVDNYFEMERAGPLCLVGGRAGQLLNVVVGEMPRLGFLTSFRLLDLRLPEGFGPGPAFGGPGILALCDKKHGPLLCRSMRPAVGLDLKVMAKLNRDVLIGGFHMVKDDELACFADLASFRRHLESMLSARDAAMQVTGERKLYLANLLCEPDELLPRWELACELGVDGALVAPFIQGLGILPMLARQGLIPLLAHNAFADVLTRNLAWGIDDTAVSVMLRHLGADWFVTPGPFGSAGMAAHHAQSILQAATGKSAKLLPMMPIMQGGKHPAGLPDYHESVGGRDFMLIVAHWVDSYPKGLKAAAQKFREAIDSMAVLS
jgi:ribulose 1,5-bisphosphate carboxylase large subunit-like protein